jgi:lipoprotein-anchoring transpeptidase ErfK/SrfK
MGSDGEKEPTRTITVDLAGKTLKAYQDGALFMETPISGGRAGHPTSVGVFSIDPHRRFKHHTSSVYPPPKGGAPMNYALFFHGGEAIHQGDPNVPSHGCIHVGHADAPKLFDWVAHHPVTVSIINPPAYQHPHAHKKHPHASKQPH